MNDKKLLELAAKAADYGFFFNRKISDDAYEWKSNDGMLWQWNPLMDDGQALRLAVKLQIDVDNDHPQCCIVPEPIVIEYYKDNNGDAYAATRRAIVRAAAELGKSTNGTK